jgi:hypothetical protein
MTELAPVSSRTGSPMLPLRSPSLSMEKTAIGALATGLVLGVGALLLTDPAAHRNSDTTVERRARISPVGEVSVTAPGTAVGASLAVGSDS